MTPTYEPVGSLDYGDPYGSLVPVFSCQECWALVTYQGEHNEWHRKREDGA